MSEDVYTLEEWIMHNEAEELREDIETHISALTDLDSEDAEGLSRMIMISIRQHVQMKGFTDEE